ncbi:hypothetical protein FOL47_010232 [Perkinsus chesapeaki]|uniref:Uncharacterized protein n=1 Tax=Perkinsus chesapeaki TaxID=330153 RepID=A0A7J6L438_PERCH|nr:hypothetical protein FOL47_010232 [Perkinsus chesapeaki]
MPLNDDVLASQPQHDPTAKRLERRRNLYNSFVDGSDEDNGYSLTRAISWKEFSALTDACLCILLAASQQLEALAKTITPSISRANWWSICSAYPLWQGAMRPMALVSVLMPSAIKGCRVAPPSRESCVAFYIHRAWSQVQYAGQHSAALETLAIGARLLLGQQIPSRPEQLNVPTKLRAPPGPMEALLYGLYKLIAEHALQVATYGHDAPSFDEWLSLTPVQRIGRIIDKSAPGGTAKALAELAVPCDVPPIPSPNPHVISAVYGSSPDALPSGLLESCASTVAVTVETCAIEYLSEKVRSTRSPNEAVETIERIADVVEASKPTLKPQDRIIRSTARLVQFAVDSVYESRYAPAVRIHPYVSEIYQSLPAGTNGTPRGMKPEAWEKLMARADRLDGHTTCAELMDSNFNVVCGRVTFRFLEACSGGGDPPMTIADKEYANRLVYSMLMEAGSKPRSEQFWKSLLDIILYIVNHGLSNAVTVSQSYSQFCDQLVGQDSLPEVLRWAVDRWRSDGGGGGEVDDWIEEAAIRAIDSADALRYDIGIERARRLLKLTKSSRARKLSQLLDICAKVFDLLSYREYRGPGIGGKLVGQAVNVVLKAAATPNARASFRDFAFSTPHEVRMLLATHGEDEAAFKLLNAVVAYNLQSVGNSDGLRDLCESVSPGSWLRGGLLLVCQYSLAQGRVEQGVRYTRQLKQSGYGNCWRLASAVVQSDGLGQLGEEDRKEMNNIIADGVTTCSDDDIYDAVETMRSTSAYLDEAVGIRLPVLADDEEWADTIPEWPPEKMDDIKTDFVLPGSTLGGGIFSSNGCDVSQLMDLCASVKSLPQGAMLPAYVMPADGSVVDAGISLLSEDPDLAGILMRLGARPEEVDEKLLCPALDSDVMPLGEQRRVVSFVRSLSVTGSPREARLGLIVKLLDRCVPLKEEYRYLSVVRLAGDEAYREAVLLRISRQQASCRRDGCGMNTDIQKALGALAQLDGDDEIPEDSESEVEDVATPSAKDDWADVLDGDIVERVDDPEFIAKVAGSGVGGKHSSYNRTAAVLSVEQLATVLTSNVAEPSCEDTAMRLFPKCIVSPDIFEERLNKVLDEISYRKAGSPDEQEQLVQRYLLTRKLLDIVAAGGGQVTEALTRLHGLLPGLDVRRLPLSIGTVFRECGGSLSLVGEVCVVIDGVAGIGFEAGDLAELAVERKKVFDVVPPLLKSFVKSPVTTDNWNGDDEDKPIDGHRQSATDDWDLGDDGWDDDMNGEAALDDEDLLGSDPDGWDF